MVKFTKEVLLEALGVPEDKKSIKNWDLHQKITKRAPLESVSIFKKD
jgi:hypothetical protein